MALIVGGIFALITGPVAWVGALVLFLVIDAVARSKKGTGTRH